MGSCVSKSSFTVNRRGDSAVTRLQPILFSVLDAEQALRDAETNNYLLYKDHDSNKIVLSVRLPSYIRHYRITEMNSLYYLDGQPYPYLDSIVFYHKRHKLNGAKLNKQAPLSARVVRMFAHRVASSNGNNQLDTSKSTPHGNHLCAPSVDSHSSRHSRNSSSASLITSSSDSTDRRRGMR